MRSSRALDTSNRQSASPSTQPSDERTTVRSASAIMRSLDEMIGALHERLREREAERLCRLQVDRELECGGLLDRQVSGPGSFQDLVHVRCRTPPQTQWIW